MRRLILTGSLILLSLTAFSQGRFDFTSERLNSSKLSKVCDDELKWMRNEIYARKGYKFSSKEIQAHFENYSWYKPVGNNNQVKLSKTEQDNVTILKAEEERRDKRAKAIKSYFGELKKGVLSNNSSYALLEGSQRALLIDILNRIQIDEMTFCGQRGLYQVSIDNGLTVGNYYLKVINQDIMLGYRNDDSLFLNEDEEIETGGFGYWWEFDIDDNNTITYLQQNGAG